MGTTTIARAGSPGWARVVAAGALAAGCIWAAGCDGNPGEEPVDAAPPDAVPRVHVVRGTASGLLGPLDLALRHGTGTERLTVAADSAFAFTTRLGSGEAYEVGFAGADTPCGLRNQAGTIADGDVEVELVCVSLTGLVVSGVAPAITLVPGTTEYAIDVPFLQDAATLTATLAGPADTLRVAGAAVPGDTPSAPLALAPGDNTIDLVVENSLGWQRTYRVTVRRAAALAQHLHGQASNPSAWAMFGTSVAVSGDLVAIGAVQEGSGARGVNGDQNDRSAQSSGAVYVFRRTGTSWQQEAYIKASNTGADDAFGVSVALSGDTLAVGANAEDSSATGIDGDQDDDRTQNNGAVYVFRRAGGVWQQEAYIKAAAARSGQYFGSNVALSGDTLAVTAPYPPTLDEPVLATTRRSRDALADEPGGQVYVFRRDAAGWRQEAVLVSSNRAPTDGFAGSLALSGDTIAVGARHEDSAAKGIDGDQDDETAASAGAVYVFRRSGTAWQQEAYVKASNASAFDVFGTSVALAGEVLAVGAAGEDGGTPGVDGDQTDESVAAAGAVYVFRRSGTIWQQEAYVKASNPGVADEFGHTVALAGDTLAVGAAYEDSAAEGVGGDQASNGAQDSGAVYLFRRGDATWRQEAYVKSSPATATAELGRSLALSLDTLVAGAPVGFIDDGRGDAFLFH